MVDLKINTISDFIKLYDKDLYWHCVRTANLACDIGKKLKCESDLLYMAGLIHDIGKIAIPNIILKKPDKLNLKERNVVDMHSVLGYSISKNIGIPDDICNLILLHHGIEKERFGVDIEISDRLKKQSDILRGADCYDALTSNRVYHKSFTHHSAIMIMLNENQIDNLIINSIDEIIKQGQMKRSNVH